ncbi:hypothetical protein NA57DRAFT_58462 [Rhizodiscina lignyota]|uniref:Uncharacterized protein n=1 Tax=Rhizodiscina lignyota TaxID=1504668 RepID=A0A9P4M471_9PEZI|nr:hypothetical protein NA57DRAFT_58462 [Rhizodiscina lignyota]
MCYHQLYIFTTCGHSTLSSTPIHLCAHFLSTENPSSSTTCPSPPQTHPYRSHKTHTLCLFCSLRRDYLLMSLESEQQEVRFDEWRWKVAYRNPAADSEGWRRWGNDEARHGTLGVEEMERRIEALRKAKVGGGMVKVGFALK